MSGPGSGKSIVLCPRCKFPNTAGSPACLSCRAELPGATGEPPVRRGMATRKLSREELERVMGPKPPAVVHRSPDATIPPSYAEETPTQPIATPAWMTAPAPPAPPVPPAPPAPPPPTRVPLDAGKAVAWLVCDPLPPVPVGSQPFITIGRTDECDLVLAHASVSRCHAVLRIVGDTLLFEDRSTYGSYVNGERQVHVTVKPGDVLTIGPFEVRVVAREAVASASRDMNETRPLGTAVLPSADAMTGRLEKQPLAEVLQTIEFNRKSGTLDLVAGEKKGVLVVYEGMPIHADFAGVEGEEAVFQMVALTGGYYAFRTKIEPGEQTISKTMTALLLEASRRIDMGG